MTSVVIPGVPRVAFYEGGPRCPEDICFPSVLRALQEHRGWGEMGCEKCGTRTPECRVSCTYAWMMGATGAAAFHAWKPGWAPDNPVLRNLADDPLEPYRRGFEAAGLAAEWVGPPATPRDEGLYRDAVRESVGRGMPVVGFGVVGPEESCLITGYEEDGETVLGWSFFQKVPPFNRGVTEDAAGHFRKRGWFADTPYLAVVREGERLPLEAVSRRALEWMLAASRTSWTGGRHTGAGAYTAWAEHLADDKAFAGRDEAVLRERHDVHNGAVGLVVEARWYGAVFLVEASRILHYRAAEHLLRAAACYTREHELMWRIWDLAGGNGNPQAHRRLAVGAVRAAMIPVIHMSRESYVEAAHHIERALAVL